MARPWMRPKLRSTEYGVGDACLGIKVGNRGAEADLVFISTRTSHELG